MNSAKPRAMPGAGSTYIAEIVGGQADGEAFLRSLNECTPPDALADRVASMIDSRAKLRGFCRALQKKLERLPK